MAKNHTSFWYDGFDDVAAKYETQKNSLEYLLQLNNIRRAIANFVSIATGKSIPVHFSTGQQSYASGKKGQEFIVISAETDPNKFDANTGAALHESSHIIWSRRTAGEPDSIPLFTVLEHLEKEEKERRFISPELEAKAAKVQEKVPDIIRNFQFILNIMEDRRIDQLMYQRAYGYRPYYEAMYANYWHSEEIGELLQKAETRVPTIRNYLAHLVNMTNDAFDPDALPGLRKMAELIDLPNIQRFQKDKKWETWDYNTLSIKPKPMSEKFSKFPDMVQVALTILESMYDFAIFDQMSADEKKKAEEDAKNGVGSGMSIFDPNNHDLFPPGTKFKTRPMTSEEKKKFDEMMKDIVKNTTEGVEKKHIDQQAENDMRTLETSKVQMTETGKGIPGKLKAKCIVYHKLTKQLIRQAGFIFSRGYKDSYLQKELEDGARLGLLLANRIRCIADETPITYTRKDKGHLDKRLVAGLGYDNANIFHHVVIEKHKPVLVHLTIDSSGSMQGTKWHQSMKLAAALAKVAEQIKTINLTISFRASDGNLVHILMAYDSRVDTFVKIRELFPMLIASGGTPEGLSYEAIKDEILLDKVSKKYFINISDGEPSHSYYDPTGRNHLEYHGDVAFRHTRSLIAEMEAAGITILAYFVSDSSYDAAYSKNNFRRMYGKASQFINAGSVTDVARTMNKMFLDGSIQ